MRAYAHPLLLRVAENINGEDFVPFTEGYFIKDPGLGASVAWHQDGTTHWDNPKWDQYEVMSSALANFLYQNGCTDRAVTEKYLNDLFTVSQH